MSSSGPGLFNICKTKNWHKVGPYCNRYAEDVAYIDDVNHRSGNTALHEACRHQPPARVVQNLLTVQPLLSSHVNADGDLPLHIACRNQASLTVLRILLESNLASSRQRDGTGNHTAVGILCCHASTETTMKEPNYKSTFWQKIRLLLLAASSDRNGQRIILSKDMSHLLHAAVDVGAPTAVLKFCFDEFVGVGSHQRDPLGQYPIHVAVNIPKESTVGVNPVFRIAKTSTIARLLQEYPESANAQDTENHPLGRYPIHTALLQGHDWFSGVRELTRCAPDVLLADDPEFGLKPFVLAMDIETTFQLLRRMPHALEASRRSVQEVHAASEAFPLPEDSVVTLPTAYSIEFQAEPRNPTEATEGSVNNEKTQVRKQRFPGVVSSIGFAITKAMIKPFQSSSLNSTRQMTLSEISGNEASGSTQGGQSSISSVFEDQSQKPRSADSTSITKLGQLRRMSFERKMTTIVEQLFEDEDEADSTELTIEATESSSSPDNHEGPAEVNYKSDCDGETKQSRMPSLEGSNKPWPTGQDGPIAGDACRVSPLGQLRSTFLDRLEIKQPEQHYTREPTALATSEGETPVIVDINEAKARLQEEKPMLYVNPETSEDSNANDYESNSLTATDVSQQDEVTDYADPQTTFENDKFVQRDSTHDGTEQQSKYNKYRSMLTARPVLKRDPRKAWRNDLPIDATPDFDCE